MVEMSKHMRATLDDVPTLKIFDFSTFVSKIPDVIKFTLGEPDFDTPEYVKQAGIRAIQNNRTHYAPQRGTTGLLQAVSARLSDTDRKSVV